MYKVHKVIAAGAAGWERTEDGVENAAQQTDWPANHKKQDDPDDAP